MMLWKWAVVGALALCAAAGPAQAGKALVVDWNRGLVYPVRNGRLVRDPIVTNTGRVLRGRHLGTFYISQKLPMHRSNMYNTRARPIRRGQAGAPMRYWMRLGGTAQGFHLSPAFTSGGSRHRSNGCYRLSASSARWMYRWASVGTPVHVVTSVCRSSRFAYLGGGRCRRRVATETGPGPNTPAQAASAGHRQAALVVAPSSAGHRAPAAMGSARRGGAALAMVRSAVRGGAAPVATITAANDGAVFVVAPDAPARPSAQVAWRRGRALV